MGPVWQRWLTAGASCALLAAMLVCPVMAVVEAAPAPSAASNCHDEGRGEHGDDAAAFTCCATTMQPASVHRVHDTDAALPAADGSVQAPAQRAHRPAPRPLPPSAAPPLFLQHASLLI